MSSEPITPSRPPSLRWLLAFLGASMVLHVIAFLAMGQLKPRPVEVVKPVELVMVEVEPPPPEPEPEALPPPPKVAPKVVVAKVDDKPPPEPPPDEAPPPPPNEETPPEPDAKPPPLVVGLSMSSTSAAGDFKAPIGNTQYGRTERQAGDPNSVKGYSAPKYAPAYSVDSPPELVGECEGQYPDEAKRLNIEGAVVLSVLIDNIGQVQNVKLVTGLGYGLDEAAMTRIKRCRFKPAHKGGEAVSTEIKYRFTFVLD
ncbi:MAG: energy transducer TonB [Myxococcaceae bacterium]